VYYVYSITCVCVCVHIFPMIGRCYISCSTALYALLGLGPAECRARYNIDFYFYFYGGGAINACECGGCLVPLFCINTAAVCIAVR
jgi:hypothetical protein